LEENETINQGSKVGAYIMTKEEIYKFMNSNPTCYLATAIKDQPKVRGMMMYSASAEGIIFHTGDFKNLYNDILDNPKVELCFYNSDKTIQIRVQGLAEELNDDNLKKEIVAKRTFLKPWVDEKGYDMLKLIKVKPLRATVWTFKTNLNPTVYEEI
jgi:uncharacterized pyridoxamine 5'-phosphate oxidase family protein